MREAIFDVSKVATSVLQFLLERLTMEIQSKDAPLRVSHT